MTRTGPQQAVIGALCTAFLLSGCVMHSTIPRHNDSSVIIYQISEREAFLTVLDIYASELPKQSVDDIVEKNYRGYHADNHFALDWDSHRILVIPTKGIDERGQEVRGYRYDIRSSGTRAMVIARHNIMRDKLHKTFATRAVVVTNVRDGDYETDGKAYLGRKRDALDIKVQGVDIKSREVRPPGASAADRLGELKTLRDRGLISEEEYQAKRRQILDGM